MEARNINNNIWLVNIQLRYNGAISIGSLMRVIDPLTIQNYMQGDVPMMKTIFPVILFKFLNKLPLVYINLALKINSSLAFVYNKVNLNINYFVAARTSCTGNLCDGKHISDFTTRGGSCGCYGSSKISSNLVIQHSIEIETSNGTLPIDKFSSKQIRSLYNNAPIPGAAKIHQLQMKSAIIKMFDCIEKCIGIINEYNGYNDFRWCKRGIVNNNLSLVIQIILIHSLLMEKKKKRMKILRSIPVRSPIIWCE